MRRSTFGLYTFVWAAILLGISVSHAEAQWRYYYFDQPQPLNVDPSKVAVFGGNERGVDTLAQSLSKHGIQVADVRASVMPGLSIIRLPASARNESGVRALVKSIADDDLSAFASPVFLNEGGDPVIITQHLHIGFHPHVSAAEAEKLLAESGAGTIEERDWARMNGVYRVRCGLRDGFEVLELANTLAQRPEVRFAEPDKVTQVHESLTPNDPLFPFVWGLHNTGGGGAVEDMDIDAPEAWDITTGDSDVVVVIIDNGVQQDHPDLNQRPGFDFTDTSLGGGPYNQCDNHGTAVAGCVSAIINNGLGTVGVSPDATVAGAKVGIAHVVCGAGPREGFECVVDADCYACAGGVREGLSCEINDHCPESYCDTSWLCNGCPGTFTMADSWLVNALDWAETIDARVTNCSFSMGAGSSSITNKFEDTRNAGILHFASAGNYSEPVVRYPANLPTVNAVSALNWDGNLAGFSSWGEGLAVSAPGVDLWSTDRTGSDGYTSSDYTLFGGTSAASPYSAGVAALVISQKPYLKVEDVESAMYQSAVDRGDAGYDIEYGWGFVNAHQALLWLTGTIRGCDVGQFVASDAEESAEFGLAVAVDGNAAVIGAPKHGCLAGSQCGAAYAYLWSGSSWGAEQQITASDADPSDKFGSALAVSGEVMLVGAPEDDHSGESNAGSAYVFRDDGGAWNEEQQLTAPVASSSTAFGTAVAMEGDLALVGSPGEAAGGAVYVFRYVGSTWDLEDTLVAADATTGDAFGTSVSLNGDVAVVGAPQVDCGAGADCGAAYVYRYNGAVWAQEQKLTSSSPQTYDWFGAAVSVYGSRAMIGSPLADSVAGDNSGAVYVFEQSGAIWTEEEKVTAPDSKASDYLGWSLAFRNGVGLAGARGLDCAYGGNCGAAHIIRQDEGGNWGVDARLMSPDPGAGDGYGRSVALGEHAVLIGANARDSLGLNASGAAYAYAFPADCNENDIADMCDILSGYSTDLDGNNRPDECVCEDSSPAHPELLDVPLNPESRKIRYLSFSAGDEGQLQAARITFGNVPSPYAAWTGTQLWVQEPQAYCENSGTAQADPCPTGVGGLPVTSFWGATLGCDPYFTDWTQYDLVHVWNEGILPGAVYDIQILDETCLLTSEESYSTALTITQSAWADLVSDCTTTPCGPPDGGTGIVDVTAILDKWKNLPGNVKKVRADIEGSPAGDHRVPDQAINITDVTYCLGAFLGDTYPGPGFPAPNDPPVCSP